MKGMTKTELERFEQVVRENEQLKAKNAELEKQLAALIEKLSKDQTE